MKNTIIVGIVFFVVGGLIGFGVDWAYLARKSAEDPGQTEQENTENGEGSSLADSSANAGTVIESTSTPVAVGSPNPAVGLSLTGQVPADSGRASLPFAGASAEARPEDMTAARGNVLSVEDQKPGNMVVIQSLTMGANGWVVIYDDSNGKPSHILGAHRFNAGTYARQNVELLKGTEEGKVYYAMLHADDGDRKFDYRTDLQVKDGSDNTVMMRFVATNKSAQE